MAARTDLAPQLSPLMAALIAVGLAGCATQRGSPDNEPTIATLIGREVKVEQDAGIPANPDKAMAAYREFLAAAPRAPQRAEALKRLGDLEMDSVDARIADGRAAGTIGD